jgi:hypothetical protein
MFVHTRRRLAATLLVVVLAGCSSSPVAPGPHTGQQTATAPGAAAPTTTAPTPPVTVVAINDRALPLPAGTHSWGSTFDLAAGRTVQEFAAVAGTPVLAAHHGVVGALRGTSVTLTHPDGSRSRYGPVQAVVRAGEQVAAGAEIGTLTTAVLQLSVSVDGRLVDPLTWLIPPAVLGAPDLVTVAAQTNTAASTGELIDSLQQHAGDVAVAQDVADAAVVRSEQLTTDPSVASPEQPGPTPVTPELQATLDAVADDPVAAADVATAVAMVANALADTAQQAVATSVQVVGETTAVLADRLEWEILGRLDPSQTFEREVVSRWAQRLRRLAADQVPPLPLAATLPAGTLPAGFAPVVVDGVTQPGIAVWAATGEMVTSVEAMRAVSWALTQLGAPYRAEGSTEAGWGCAELAQQAWQVPVEHHDPGVLAAITADVAIDAGVWVFTGNERRGVHHVGIAVDAEAMITADAAGAQVQIRRVAEVWGTGMPGMATQLRAVPNGTGKVIGWRCGQSALQVWPPSTPAWGNWSNGTIPTSALCTLAGRPGHRLRCDAAEAFEALSEAYARRFGSPLCITDSYRSLAGQRATYGPGRMGAYPGRSNHGWGLAIDVCNPGMTAIYFGDVEYRWLRANGPRYGWYHPQWAQQGGSKPEAWHWHYGTFD